MDTDEVQGPALGGLMAADQFERERGDTFVHIDDSQRNLIPHGPRDRHTTRQARRRRPHSETAARAPARDLPLASTATRYWPAAGNSQSTDRKGGPNESLPDGAVMRNSPIRFPSICSCVFVIVASRNVNAQNRYRPGRVNANWAKSTTSRFAGSGRFVSHVGASCKY